MGFLRRILGEGGEPVVRRQTIKVSGPLELRDGHPVLNEQMKAELERSGVDPAVVEAQLYSAPTTEGSRSSLSTSFTGNVSLQCPSGRQMLAGHLEMRDGHPVLSDEIRAELERRGIDLTTVESQLANAPKESFQASYGASGEMCSCSFSENGVTGEFEVSGGRPILTADSRAEIERQGADPAAFEARFQALATVNEHGEVVLRAIPDSGTEHPGVEPDRPLFRKPSTEDLLGGHSGE